MESPQGFGGSEECQSSESGWTMYIGSPAVDAGGQVDIEEDDADGHVDVEEADVDRPSDSGDEDDDDCGNNECDSDDSMASDASSGPSHALNLYAKGSKGKVLPPSKNCGVHCFGSKGEKKPMQKKGGKKKQ